MLFIEQIKKNDKILDAPFALMEVSSLLMNHLNWLCVFIVKLVD